MKRLLTAAIVLSLVGGSAAMAQPYQNDRHDSRNERHDTRNDNNRHDNGNHRGWYKGGHIDRGDWNRGQRVNDYRRYHLQRPPRGYEWRRVDNNYVLAAAATGLIMGLMLANH